MMDQYLNKMYFDKNIFKNDQSLLKFTRQDYENLADLRERYSRVFFLNRTKYFFKMMYEYIKNAQVWRISIMGETRVGKSEIGSYIAFVYEYMFNHCMDKGQFDNIDLFQSGIMKKEKINFEVQHVQGSQTDYIYHLRNASKEKTMRFGQVHQIDESKDKIGGVGSYSEEIELTNLNNIVAKFMQSEIWITPRRFEIRNAPYGLYAYKKDIKNRVNWCLLYKIEIRPNGTVGYKFLGWVKFPLHTNEEFRKIYNLKKNSWIKEEISGNVDKRMNERQKVSHILAKLPEFSELAPSGKKFVLSKGQQMILLTELIIEGKSQNWNEVERYLIIEEARLICARNKKEEDKNVKETENIQEVHEVQESTQNSKEE